jgi:type IV pilus assembly protein PilB
MVSSDKIKAAWRQHKKLGELLIETGALDQKTLEDALALQKLQKKKLGEILQDMEAVTDIEIARALANQLDIPFVRLDKIVIPLNVVKRVPAEIAHKFTLLPVRIVESRLWVAMVNPLDFEAVNDLRFVTNLPIHPLAVPESDALAALKKYYPKPDLEQHEGLEDHIDATMAVIQEAPKEKEEERDLLNLAGRPPVVRFTNAILADAIRMRASDIHIEPQKVETDQPALIIRCRIDGVMHEMMKTDQHVHAPLVSRLKVISGLDISDRRRPQDGKAQIRFGEKTYDLRVSTIPTTYGEKMTLRILDPASARLMPEDLGFASHDLVKVQNTISMNQGMMLVTGPTGSGKSSTLYACLNKLNTPEVNIITVEDPVEFDVPGINQVQIHAKAGISFATGLRSILRQDPDIVMVGEIRDTETAETAFQAAQTGHLVLSTLHTNDAVSTITRLLNLSIDDYQISAALLCIIGQRLARRIHPACRTKDSIDKRTMDRIRPYLENDQAPVFYRGRGCKKCHQTGYSGRIGIFEVLTVTPGIKAMIKPTVSAQELLTAAQQEGFKTMTQDGISKAVKGLTTIEEVFRVAPPQLQAESDYHLQTLHGLPRHVAQGLETEPFAGQDEQKATLASLVSDQEPNAFQKNEAAEVLADPPKILVAEDNEITRMVICEALKSENYRIILADDGQDALKKIQTHSPDLVISDYMMPRLDGMALVKALKSKTETRPIPILILSAKDDVDSEIAIMKSGADDYLTKPVNLKRFLVRIAGLLRRRRHSRSGGVDGE